MSAGPFNDLSAAYQLHYYLCVRTKRNRPLFVEPARSSLEKHLAAICEQCKLNILQLRIFENNLRMLLSLRPEHSVAEAVKKIKGNSSRLLCRQYSDFQPGHVWSRGYFAKSTGKIEESVVSAYIAGQAEHHGYKRGAASLVSSYEEREPAPSLSYHNHAAFNLTHHLVLETERHAHLFDDVSGCAMIDYFLRVAAKKQFQIAQIRVLPDHCHLRVRLHPTMSVLDCARGLMNNSWAMMNRRFPGALIERNTWNVWEPSFYAGTTGDVTTAEIRSYLKS